MSLLFNCVFLATMRGRQVMKYVVNNYLKHYNRYCNKLNYKHPIYYIKFPVVGLLKYGLISLFACIKKVLS